jgi:hypothetical protein
MTICCCILRSRNLSWKHGHVEKKKWLAWGLRLTCCRLYPRWGTECVSLSLAFPQLLQTSRIWFDQPSVRLVQAKCDCQTVPDETIDTVRWCSVIHRQDECTVPWVCTACPWLDSAPANRGHAMRLYQLNPSNADTAIIRR